MKKQLDGRIGWRLLIISLVAVLTWSCATMAPDTPPSERRPLVILLSGIDGPTEKYRTYAVDVAGLGYYTVLLDGRSFSPHPKANLGDVGLYNLRREIMKAQSSPKALPGKAAVIGFSLGGGDALSHAATMPELVSAIVAYYPMTSHVSDMRSFVAQFQVPILVLAGGRDTYANCCLIGSMRDMEAAAKEGGKPFELVVYPEAYHNFNHEIEKRNYRAEDAADAWQRTTKMLSQYQPLR